LSIKQNKTAEIELAAATTKYQEKKETDFLYWQIMLQRMKVLPSGDRVLLDAGCGSGTFGLSIVNGKASVVGIDICKTAVYSGKAKSKKQKLDFLSIVGDLENLPLKDNSLDTYLCRAALHHFLCIDSVVEEIKRVLKPGGVIVFIEPNGSNPIVKLSTFGEKLSGNLLLSLGLDTPNETIHDHICYLEALEQQGFSCVRISSCYPGSLPPLPQESSGSTENRVAINFVQGLVKLRQFCYFAASKLLTQPFNGNVLLITARKLNCAYDSSS
jgi:SAM-dependent methyltransferase